jgi:hypothetical protein
MNEMVERVARAICALRDASDADCVTYGKDNKLVPYWTLFVPDACAAIAAMREPTQAMLKVADSFGDYGREPWPEMIDAALKD